jgi:hypothetical protein
MPHATVTTNPRFDQCIDDCLTCASTRNTTLAHCLVMGGRHADALHIALMVDCAAICETAAASMARNSPVHVQMSGACAEVCQACGNDCRTFANDPIMQECADVCRRCAESCQRMAA